MKNIIFFILFAVSINIFADDFSVGTVAYNKKDYVTAYNKWIGLAGKGDQYAQVNIANLYLKGLGVAQNLSEAFRWMDMAAEIGDTNAQTNLGEMYQYGNGVLKDLKKADMWFTIATNAGNSRALSEKIILEKQMSDDDKAIVKNLVTTCMNQMLRNCN